MAQCNILEALKYVEDLYNSTPNDKSNAKSKKALRYLFEDINAQRAYLQQIASFAGVKALDITAPKPARSFLEETPPWSKEDVSYKEAVVNTYAEFATKMIEFIKSKKQVAVEFDRPLAIKILKGDKNVGFAEFLDTSLKGGTITYPDFKGVLKSDWAIKNISKSLGVSDAEVKSLIQSHLEGSYLQMTKLHEHIHAGAVSFMKTKVNDPKTKYVNNLYQKMLKMAESDRPSLNDIQNGYWKTNVDEFLAVALSNVDMMDFLNDMPATGFTSTLHKLVNTLGNMVGIKQKSESQALLNIFMEMTEASLEENAELDTPASGTQSKLFQGIPIGELNDIINEINKCKSEG